MSVSVTLKDFVVNKIRNLSSVESCYPYMAVQFSGYPAVTVTLPTIDGEFSSTAENSRVFGFTIYIFFPVGSDAETPKTKPREQYAEDVVATVIDDIIDAFDTDFIASNLGLPSVYTCKYIEAADVRPDNYLIENGLHFGAELSLRIYTERTVV